ncbi:CobW family GTP-binding protein [Meiothermus taiwanensis]|uniref:Cobalamin synthesis protein P47K n=2 Tax=Meiothermus taiwanensis TaxID=172827 RepID=A0ABN5LXV9_9DEIN|nr:GTP-binding protein [Meiothermus taiwanensis]AWR85507.1 cobalamin synthesis protein P47K [Meiothermus taiwanensis WR-220]KIQ55662.1 cobalamin synthesis protein P47K [Meiothermus taiwanensis]KZK16424.1 cobalamin synthesis protein P47K [Meiothermus taiwanensis]RIH80107.1 putative metal chaperone YciC [Meiothermus taiwanensis]
MRTSPIPVGVLVGFLGAGKTTLINHLLSSKHGKKIAVVVNEFGEVNVDARLVRHTTERMVEMSNGCICCTLREDLLLELRELSQMDLDYILIESTGIGEPLPIAQTFHMEDLPSRVRLDAIITVVDSEAFWDDWNRKDTVEDEEGNPVEQPLAPLLADQLEFTSIVLLNKADRVDEVALLQLESFIHELNPYARIYRTVRGQIEPEKLLHTGLYNYQLGLAHPDWEAEWNKPSSEVEEYGFESFVYRSEVGFDAHAFEKFLHNWPKNIVRAKGWVKFVNHVPVTLSQAGKQIVLEPRMEPLQQHELAALPPEEQTHYQQLLAALNQEPTEIVFIGRGIRKQRRVLEGRLNACLAPVET